MFVDHKIVCENKEPVLYLFAQSIDASITLVKGIFEHLHEEILIDWAQDYLIDLDVSFVGSLIKVVAGSTIVRDLEFPFTMKKATGLSPGKIIPFKPFET